MSGHGFVTVTNGEAHLTYRRQGIDFTIKPGQSISFWLPEGSVLEVASKTVAFKPATGNLKARLRLWQAATFMTCAALILSLAACTTGTRTRADARAWAAYSQGVGEVIQQEGNAREYSR